MNVVEKDVRKDRVIGVRVTEEQYREIQRITEQKYITGSTLGRVLFEMFLRQEVRI